MRDKTGRFVSEDKIVKKCLGCELEFQIPKCRKNTAKFCSRLCQNKTNKTRFWLGKKRSNEVKIKISKALKSKGIEPSIRWIGAREKHWNWQGGKSYLKDERFALKRQIKYVNWRKSVFERDGFTCQACGVVGGKIEADHIKPWSVYPDLRYKLENGRTLCVSCHRKTDTWGRRIWKIRQSAGI